MVIKNRTPGEKHETRLKLITLIITNARLLWKKIVKLEMELTHKKNRLRGTTSC